MVHPLADPGTLHLVPLRPQLLARPPLSEVVGKRDATHAPALGGNSCDLRDRSHSPSTGRLQLRDCVQPVRLLLFFLPMVTVALTSLSLVRLGLQKHRMGYVGVGILSFVVTVAAAYLVSTLQSLGEAAGFTLSNQLTSYVTIIIVFVGGAIWYFGARAVHLRRHGVGISIAFLELPPD